MYNYINNQTFTVQGNSESFNIPPEYGIIMGDISTAPPTGAPNSGLIFKGVLYYLSGSDYIHTLSWHTTDRFNYGNNYSLIELIARRLIRLQIYSLNKLTGEAITHFLPYSMAQTDDGYYAPLTFAYDMRFCIWDMVYQQVRRIITTIILPEDEYGIELEGPTDQIIELEGQTEDVILTEEST